MPWRCKLKNLILLSSGNLHFPSNIYNNHLTRLPPMFTSLPDTDRELYCKILNLKPPKMKQIKYKMSQAGNKFIYVNLIL